MIEELKVIVVQADIIWEDIDANLKMYDAMLSEIAISPDLILFPEMFQTGLSTQPSKVAEPMDGKTIRWMKRKAEELNCSLAGSMVVSEKRKFYNRLIYIDQYENLTWYDKRHLFTIDGEEEKYTRGLHRIVVPLKGWNLSFIICYDLRFPVWIKNRNDYDVLINVANWPSRRNQLWSTLLTARAIENMCYVIGVNRVGHDNNDIHYTGNSMVIDPKGIITAQLKESQKGLLPVTLSWEQLDTYRAEFPVWKDWDDFKINI
jgi:predicted amidohydrolase